MSTSTYVKAFLRDKDVAAVTPSSSFCTRHVCRMIDFDRVNTIVEYGPGTGVITRYLLKQMSEDTRLLAIEANEKFVSVLQQEFNDPRLTICQGDVRNVQSLMTDHNISEADCIVSGIPFSWLDRQTRMDIVGQTYKALRPNGAFVAYQTIWQPKAHLKKPAVELFGGVETEFELLNLPPMRIYRAVKHTNGHAA